MFKWSMESCDRLEELRDQFSNDIDWNGNDDDMNYSSMYDSDDSDNSYDSDEENYFYNRMDDDDTETDSDRMDFHRHDDFMKPSYMRSMQKYKCCFIDTNIEEYDEHPEGYRLAQFKSSGGDTCFMVYDKYFFNGKLDCLMNLDIILERLESGFKEYADCDLSKIVESGISILNEELGLDVKKDIKRVKDVVDGIKVGAIGEFQEVDKSYGRAYKSLKKNEGKAESFVYGLSLDKIYEETPEKCIEQVRKKRTIEKKPLLM